MGLSVIVLEVGSHDPRAKKAQQTRTPIASYDRIIIKHPKEITMNESLDLLAALEVLYAQDNQ